MVTWDNVYMAELRFSEERACKNSLVVFDNLSDWGTIWLCRFLFSLFTSSTTSKMRTS